MAYLLVSCCHCIIWTEVCWYIKIERDPSQSVIKAKCSIDQADQYFIN